MNTNKSSKIMDKVFSKIGLDEFLSIESIKLTDVLLTCEKYVFFFNIKNKIEINFIKNSYIYIYILSHVIKKWTQVIFID
jgi:hypothetical protein